MFITYGFGNLTREPEKVETSNGKILCKMSIASNESYTKEDGTRPVQYFNVVVWNKLAEICLKYLKKGSKVFVQGNPQNRSYETADGEKKYIYEIVADKVEFIGMPKGKEEKAEQQEMTPIDDEDLPF